MPDARESYRSLLATLTRIGTLSSISAVLGWDERTQLPVKGTAQRAEQSSMLARMIHDWFTAPGVGDLLSAVEASDLMSDVHGEVAVNVRHTRREFNRATKLPGELVEEMSHTEVLAQQVWGEARARSDFAMFRPWLEKWVALKKKEADCVGHGGNPYDALLDHFEPGETADGVRRIFIALRQPLVDLVGRIVDSGRRPKVEILERRFPASEQHQFARSAAELIGFDFSAGRLDVSLHPFCSGIAPGDTRLTTRYDERYFADAFFGVLHETGHGLYEQGLAAEHFGAPMGQAASLGIHESQSRLWENLVGRSRSFWRFFFPRAQAAFSGVLADVDPQEWYFAINDIRPSLIRTEADEATYNLHVLLRFELEEAMIKGDLSPADLPAAWNAKMQTYLGITPPDDAHGCLQDIHWSGGAIGYFPTYTLGNLCAAQFFEQARRDLGDLDEQFARGDFRPLLDWLRKNIHRHGKRYLPRELVRQVTGRDLSAQPLLEHLQRKAALYGV